MKVCIFGYSGFLGKNLIKKLDNNYTLLLPSRKNISEEVNANLVFLPFNPEYIIENYKPDAIINLIGILRETKNQKYEDVHVKIVENIIFQAIKNKVKKIIHISAYGVFKGCDSRYFKTKEKAEEIIKSSGINYLIIRPSVILGEEQKLLYELKKISKFSPIIFAPKGKVAPVEVDMVVDEIINGINGKNGVIEMNGEVINYSDMFKNMIESLGLKRIVIELPTIFFFPLIITKFFMDEPLMSYDLYKMMSCGNIYDKK